MGSETMSLLAAAANFFAPVTRELGGASVVPRRVDRACLLREVDVPGRLRAMSGLVVLAPTRGLRGKRLCSMIDEPMVSFASHGASSSDGSTSYRS